MPSTSKKRIYTLIAVFILLANHCIAQLYRFTASQFICTKYQNQVVDPPEIKNLKNMPVEFDMDSSVLYIHSPSLQVYHLIGKPIEAFEQDSVATYTFWASDFKQVKCKISQKIYESEKAPHYAAFIIEYPDKTYLYYVERI